MDPDCGIRYFAAEALRQLGPALLDAYPEAAKENRLMSCQDTTTRKALQFSSHPSVAGRSRQSVVQRSGFSSDVLVEREFSHSRDVLFRRNMKIVFHVHLHPRISCTASCRKPDGFSAV